VCQSGGEPGGGGGGGGDASAAEVSSSPFIFVVIMRKRILRLGRGLKRNKNITLETREGREFSPQKMSFYLIWLRIFFLITNLVP